ncbi:MAG: site-2 protease family protein [bacterium]
MIHEVAHGYVAFVFGDPTAKYEGRLTLNPLKHIDFFGSIFLPAILLLTNSGILFGWAKPVPYNPYNLKNRRLAEGMIALAGPVTNLTLASIFAVMGRIFVSYNLVSVEFMKIIVMVVIINVGLALFNLIPLPPLDGSKIISLVLPRDWGVRLQRIDFMGMFIILLIVAFYGEYLGKVVLSMAGWLLGM